VPDWPRVEVIDFDGSEVAFEVGEVFVGFHDTGGV
jgi:hypothetical protein